LICDTHDEAEIFGQRSQVAPAIPVDHPSVRDPIAHKTKERDQIWCQPHWQPVDDEIADVLQHVVIVQRIV